MVKVIVKVHGYNWLQLVYSFLCTLVDDILEYESHMRVFCCFHVFILSGSELAQSSIDTDHAASDLLQYVGFSISVA